MTTRHTLKLLPVNCHHMLHIAFPKLWFVFFKLTMKKRKKGSTGSKQAQCIICHLVTCRDSVRKKVTSECTSLCMLSSPSLPKSTELVSLQDLDLDKIVAEWSDKSQAAVCCTENNHGWKDQCSSNGSCWCHPASSALPTKHAKGLHGSSSQTTSVENGTVWWRSTRPKP